MPFPKGPFQIKLRDEDLVLDVRQGVITPGADIIIWKSRRHETDNENQIWVYEDKQIKNVKSGLVLTAENFGRNANVVQNPSERTEAQLYDYDDYTISAREDDDLVLGVTSKTEGSNVNLVRRDNDDFKQMWEYVAL
ncbi:hypothetical protein DFQ27_009894 [Actinomortierella ambigua]|uniref:Ricin B lectin domain-containing protein n=1 Tax=Actinomortierella ambigua TaxID=1343610 RepID=A0A9P6U9C6_9FUNG|nr:hypothetical protein DFQ27_009894 [Actinomortierella ambigua]